MPRAKGGPKTHLRRKKRLKLAKGYFGSRSRLYRQATEAVDRALRFAYRGRKVKKRTFRRLWIARINAATRAHGLTYSELISQLKTANLTLNRKVLADMAMNDAEAFSQLINSMKAAPAPASN